MSVINTNITSMISQSNLTKSKSSLTTAMERLSSGMRINNAKDDAAGQAIANRMTSQIKGLAQAQRNANDGISVAQTAEGALNQINDNLQRIRELTVQSQNDTNSSDDRASIQAEITQRLDEINRISKETNFNGTKVLNAENQMKIQVGANDGEEIRIGLKEINSRTLQLDGFNVDGGQVTVNNRAATATDLTGYTAGATNATTGVTTYSSGGNAAATVASLTGAGYVAGATTNGITTYTKAGAANATATVASAVAAAAAVGGSTIDVSGVTYTVTSGNFVATGTVADAAAVSAALTPTSGTANITVTLGSTTYTATLATDGTIADWINSSDSNGTTAIATNTNIATLAAVSDVTVGLTGGADTYTDFTKTTTLDAAAMAAAITGNGATITIGSDSYDIDTSDVVTVGGAPVYVQAGALTTAATAPAENAYVDAQGNVFQDAAATSQALYVAGDGSLTTAAGTSTSVYVKDGNVFQDAAATQQLYVDGQSSTNPPALTTGASYSIPADNPTANPLAVLDNALKIVDTLRSDLGAIQNRFESAITNLRTNETNLSAARSRIEDADYAVEVANMTRAQILQQAGTSVLAQANQVPQGVLSLLR